MVRLLLALVLIFSFSAPAQNLDSLSRTIDSSRKVMQQNIDSLEKGLDSHYARIELRQNTETLERLMNEGREREKSRQRQVYFRIVLGIAFLAVLVVGLLRRKKKKPLS